MKILVLNSGSSSQKSCVYEFGSSLPADPLEPIWHVKTEWDGQHAEIEVQTSDGTRLREEIKIQSREQAIGPLLDSLCSEKTRVLSKFSEIEVVGHRIVNGGPDYRQPAIIIW